MFKTHPVFRDPDSPRIILWRYIDFPKLVHLLTTKALFFPPAAFLHKIDPFEGSLPQREHEYYLSKLNLSEEQIKRAQDHFRSLMCVSCWHYNETESVAMWKLYSQMGNGIVLQTTLADFKESFYDESIDVSAGEVRYIDYQKEYFFTGVENPYPALNGFTPFIHKRTIYLFEHEYRAIVSCLPTSEYYGKGILVPVKLELLIKKIIVAPLTPEWIYKLVKSELEHHSLNVTVEYSIFDDKPFA